MNRTTPTGRSLFDPDLSRRTLDELSALAEPGDRLSEVIERASLLVDLWECLAGCDPMRADSVAEFLETTLPNLHAIATDPDFDTHASAFICDSAEKFGSLLGLPDPDPEWRSSHDEHTWWTEPSTEPDGPDLSETEPETLLDVGRLFSLLGVDRAGPVPETPEPTTRVAAPEAEPPAFMAPATPPLCPPSSSAELESLASLDLDPDLAEVFLSEINELHEHIEDLVLRFDRGTAEPTGRADLARCFHTLKGTAGSVGLKALASRIHDLEDLLSAAKGPIDAALLHRLHDDLSYIDQTVRALRSLGVPPHTGPRNTPYSTAVARPAADQDPETTPAAATAETATVDPMVRVSASQIERLLDLVSELLVLRDTWAQPIQSLKTIASSSCILRNRLAAIERRQGAGIDPNQVERVLREIVEDLSLLSETARDAVTPLSDGARAVARIALGLWENLQGIRIVPAKALFRRLERVARDAARIEDRQVEVTTLGEETGIDRNVQELLFEPLMHLVRNAVGHGIEPSETRQAIGKPPVGQLILSASRESSTVLLSVADDGRGLDERAIEAKGRERGLLQPGEQVTPARIRSLIFEPGFSTKEVANALSGRGVGMDVVAQSIRNLRGTINVDSTFGKGTRFVLRLPARLALEHTLVTSVCGQLFALPFEAIERTALHDPQAEPAVPIIDLRRCLGFSSATASERPKLVIARIEEQSAAFLVDAIEGPRELLVQPLGPLVAGHPFIAGTSTSSSGDVILVGSLTGLLRVYRQGQVAVPEPTRPALRRALIVDDSTSVRRLACRHLVSFGFIGEEARDGLEAIRLLKAQTFDLVLTDLEMPRLDGYELLTEIHRAFPGTVPPVIVVSTRSDTQTRQRVKNLGAVAFLEKPVEPESLGQVLRNLGWDLDEPRDKPPIARPRPPKAIRAAPGRDHVAAVRCRHSLPINLAPD